MIKKTITYINLNGVSVTEDLYFNLSSVEQARLEAKYIRNAEDTLQQYIQHIAESQDIKKILAVIEDILLTAYGEREADGYGFTKNATVRERFSNSVAYAELFEQVITDPETLRTIINGAIEKPKAGNNVVSNSKLVQ